MGGLPVQAPLHPGGGADSGPTLGPVQDKLSLSGWRGCGRPSADLLGVEGPLLSGAHLCLSYRPGRGPEEVLNWTPSLLVCTVNEQEPGELSQVLEVRGCTVNGINPAACSPFSCE